MLESTSCQVLSLRGLYRLQTSTSSKIEFRLVRKVESFRTIVKQLQLYLCEQFYEIACDYVKVSSSFRQLKLK